MSDDLMRTVITQLLGETEHPYPDTRPLFRGLTNVSQIQFGDEVSTGADIDVDTDGAPRAVIVFNETDPTLAIKLYGMAGEYAMKLTDAPALTFSDDVIELKAGGFEIGTDADMNPAGGEVLRWAAII